MEKLIYIDTETTGLDKKSDSVHEIAYIVEIDGLVKEQGSIDVMPTNIGALPEDYATFNGIPKQELEKLPLIAEAHQKFVNILDKYVDKYNPKDKFFIVGYNTQGFDLDFLRKFFKDAGDDFYGSYFHNHSFDVIVLALYHLRHKRAEMESFTLESVYFEITGLSPDAKKLHGGLYDVTLTREIFLKIRH